MKSIFLSLILALSLSALAIGGNSTCCNPKAACCGIAAQCCKQADQKSKDADKSADKSCCVNANQGCCENHTCCEAEKSNDSNR